MDSPQLENGYTRIADEIMEALIRYRIPGEQMQCLLLILRKTYGFNKVWDTISNSQFVEFTGLKKTSVCRALNGLTDKNVVLKKANTYIPTYCFNKRYKEWKVLAKKLTVSKKVNQVLAKKRPTIDTITIDNKDNGLSGRVINHLNLKTGKNFKTTTKATKAHINARLSEGFTEQDFYKVINNKLKWLSDPKMMEYLRPQTLFGTKFESYLNDSAAPEKIYESTTAPTIDPVQEFIDSDQRRYDPKTGEEF